VEETGSKSWRKSMGSKIRTLELGDEGW